MTTEAISVTNAIVPKAKLEDITMIRFKAGTLDRVDAVAGKNRRARWIRELVEDALAKAEKRKPGKGAPEASE